MRAIQITAAVIAVFVLLSALLYWQFPQVILGAIYKSYEWQAGVEAKEIPVDGYSIPYYEGGSGEVLVLIHGFGDSKTSFLQAARWFTPKYRVILPEMPGFGDTARVAGRDHGIRSQVETLHGFFGKLGLRRFHLGGNSMGGHISVAYALAYPEQVNRLILISASGLKVNDNIPFSPAEKPIQTREDFDRYMDEVFVKKPWIPEPFKKHFIAKSAQDFEWMNEVRAQIRADPDYILNDRVVGISQKTLIVWGKQDKIVEIASGEAYHRWIPGSQLEIYDSGGHSPQYEYPQRTAETILDFLAR